jgi:hypothetical protein
MSYVWLFWGAVTGICVYLGWRLMAQDADEEHDFFYRVIGRSGVKRRERTREDDQREWFV